MAANRENKEGWKWVGPGIIIGRFGNKYALVHFRGSYPEVDLDDMRSAKGLFDIIGCDGTLTLHVPHSCFLNKNAQRILTWGPNYVGKHGYGN